MKTYALQRMLHLPAASGRAGTCFCLAFAALLAHPVTAQLTSPHSQPPLGRQAERFLAQRGLIGGTHGFARRFPRPGRALPAMQTIGGKWLAVGPSAVQSPSYALVTGRISSLALDTSNSADVRLYAGSTGGGVWMAHHADAGNAASVTFSPLTDSVADFTKSLEVSISIGALTVQPSGGVILAGTGDPNDALDSYYGAGILRSADNGKTWSLISATADQRFSFSGEGFAGFAWSTTNPQLVVAAVSQAYEGTLVAAPIASASYQGLYYSPDAGLHWQLATITDGSSGDVQGPNDAFAYPDGNAATAVVWNPIRKLFIAAVRFHGYYQSADGVRWTRLPDAQQPGAGLAALFCPANSTATGSPNCPIFRGALAVNPLSGDTFAWSVDIDDQDQGIWQDQCAYTCGSAAAQTVSFTQRLSTVALESSSSLGSATIQDGDYALTLAAVPSGQETMLLAGADDLWQCFATDSPSPGCSWRNTTNAASCMSAQVAPYQHALAWNPLNPLEVFVGNDGGLWRSLDAIGETGQVCASTDATHFQNLNAGLGSLAEVVSMSQATTTPYTMMTGLGVNGTAGVKSGTATTGPWPTIIGGEGGMVAIDPVVPTNWYVNNQAGVSIHVCSQAAPCTVSAFGLNPVVNDADVGGDGLTMVLPAPFLVDPLDPTQLLIATCRVWRGPADGIGWSAANAISPILDGISANTYCHGDALIRSIAAMATLGGGEVVYVGMYGAASGGGNLSGHLLSAVITPNAATQAVWSELTFNPVTNDNNGLNAYGFDISSIYIDPHDTTGNTVYVTIAGVSSGPQPVQIAYRSTDGGASWAYLSANLPAVPANSVMVDPQDASTVYIATDAGVFATRKITDCATANPKCWSVFGSGLPTAPAIQLRATGATAATHVLTAATYGRGVWQIPLLTASTDLTGVTATPSSLDFGSQNIGASAAVLPVEFANTGPAALTPTSIAISGDYTETDNCQNAILAAGASCTVQVSYSPTLSGTRSGLLTVYANVAGGQLTVPLTGMGVVPAALDFNPTQLSFPPVSLGETSAMETVTLSNSGGAGFNALNLYISAPFSLVQTTCTDTLAAGASCWAGIVFAPTANGEAISALTVTATELTQPATLPLSGMGGVPGSVQIQPSSIPPFALTGVGQASDPVSVTITNTSSTVALVNLAVSAMPTASFKVVNPNPCPTTLAALQSCAVSIQFTPIAPGLQSGNLIVASSELTTPQIAALQGVGFDFHTSQPTPASQTVANGQTGNFLLSIELLNQTRSAVVSLTCGTAQNPVPPYAACSFNPSATPTIGAGASSSVQVQIATGLSQTHGALPAGRLLPLLCCLFLLPLARRRAFFMVALLVFFVTGLSSCTNSSGGLGGLTPRSGSGITPPGTYPIPITLTSNNVAHVVTVKLTVD